MKILPLQQNTDEWLEARKNKITGSKLKDIIVKRGNGRKIGFYQLIADRLSIDSDGEDARDRGHRLEVEAIEHFTEMTGKKVETDLGMWIHDDYENIAVSPDGAIKTKGVYKEAVEVKCLGSARHLQAIIEDEVPFEYELQVAQYFIVNDDLEKLYMVFYTDRVPTRPMHVIEVTREDLADNIETYKDYEIKTLQEIEEWVEKLAF